jgi:hypothetical protein
MATVKTERSSQRPEHQGTGRDYPGEWARQMERSIWTRNRAGSCSMGDCLVHSFWSW